MKKFILILLILLTGCTKEEIKTNPLKEIGYNDDEINIIETMSTNTIEYFKNNEYNSNYITLLNNNNFVDNNFENYINLMNNSDYSIDDVLYVVNNNYYDNNITYDENTLSLMKSKYYIHNNLNKYLNYKNNANKNFNTDEELNNYVITSINSMLDNPFYQNTIKSDLSKGYLVIVNKYHYLDSDYVPENLVTASSTYGYALPIEKTTYEAFINMYNDALKVGLNLSILSPYRSYSTQVSLYNRYASKDGKALADTYSARAGYSEHQTGLAIDISRRGGNLGGFVSTNEFKWLKDNSYKYGFILRYPQGKEWITGYQYEPWHYRYVGVEVATKIYNENITFEEYYAYYVEKN